jgi:hypothetical protein
MPHSSIGPPAGLVPTILAAIAVSMGAGPIRAAENPAENAESKAVEFLQRHVAAWRRENGCFSCHNNGDAARALYAAMREGYSIRADVLAETTAWLARPALWDENKGDPGFNDKRLANLQFGAALVAAFDAGKWNDRTALSEAAQRIVADQGADGAWHIEPGNAVGSPATYGTTVATYIGLQTLGRASLNATDQAIRKARTWLRKQEPTNIPAAATLILACTLEPSDENDARKKVASLGAIQRAQSNDGGWGPYADAPSEPFDTAVVLLALSKTPDASGVAAMIARGRRFLALRQNADGGWPATTRPPGGESYAQSISTTGWATLALLATRKRE